MRIAITGTIGSGKSTVSELIAMRGYSVIDTDKLVHTFYERDGELYNWLVHYFSEDILNEDQTVDRSLLGEIVFKDQTKLNQLESKVFELVRRKILADKSDISFYEVPLLFEAGLEDLFDFVVMVDADKDLRYERLRKRSGSFENFMERERRQFDSKVMAKRSDFIVLNNGSLESLKEDVDTILRSVLNV